MYYLGFRETGYLLNKVEEIKGQLISKANCQARDSSKKTNEWIPFTRMQRVSFFFGIILGQKKNVSRLSDL